MTFRRQLHWTHSIYTVTNSISNNIDAVTFRGGRVQNVNVNVILNRTKSNVYEGKRVQIGVRWLTSCVRRENETANATRTKQYHFRTRFEHVEKGKCACTETQYHYRILNVRGNNRIPYFYTYFILYGCFSERAIKATGQKTNKTIYNRSRQYPYRVGGGSGGNSRFVNIKRSIFASGRVYIYARKCV